MEPNQQEVTEQWIEHVVGRNWEIYWAAASSSSSGELSEPPLQEDANDGFEKPAKRRKPDQDHDNGRNYLSVNEAKQSTSKSKDEETEEESSSNNDEDVDDWYAGRILKFLGYYEEETGDDDNSIPKNKIERIRRPLFQVLFVGDEEIYEMCVLPVTLRPCSRTWIQRSLALLGHGSKYSKIVSLKSPLHNQLPSDTRRLQDEDHLLKMQQSFQEELNPVQRISIKGLGYNKRATAVDVPLPEWNELLRIREMTLLIRQQIYLRSFLVPVEEDAPLGRVSSSSKSEEEYPPSEAYIRFLVDQLESAAQCCHWYDQCYNLLYIIFSGGNKSNGNNNRRAGPQERLARSDIWTLFAVNGKKILTELISLDPSLAAFKRKRSRNAPPAAAALASPTSSMSRRTKRRRMTKGVAGLFGEEKASASVRKLFSAEVEDFYSAAFLQQLIEGLATHDERWFSLAMGRMLRALSTYIAVPILNWEQKSQHYLGKTDVWRVHDDTDRGKRKVSKDDEGDNEDGGQNDSDDDNSDQQEFDDCTSIADIQELLESSRTDRVISRIDLSSVTDSLEKKLRDIASFEKLCWESLERVMDENGSPHCPEADEILKKLKWLMDTAKRRDSAVWNVEPLGSGDDNPMTRRMLRDAAENRKWFLDLKHAESIRERALFVQGLVSKHSSLPSLPSRTMLATASAERNEGLAARIQELSSLLEDNAAFFEKQSKVLDSMEGDIQSMKLSLASMIQELRKVRIVSVVEEMVVVRLDVISWRESAERVLGQSMPNYDDISEIKAGLDRIQNAQSSRRTDLTSSLRLCVKVDNEVRQFAQRDLNAFCEPVMKKIISMYKASSAWKERCDNIFATLRFHGNQTALKANENGPVKNSGMVDFKRIEDLLQEYACLETSIYADFATLSVVHEECVKWSENITDVVFENNGTFAERLSAVEAANKQEGRPKGIIVFPTRQTLDAVVDILRWHGAVKALVQNKFRDTEAAYQLLLEGIEVVEMYGKSRTTAKDQYILHPEHMRELFRQKLDSRKPIRSFLRAKLESNSITEHLLGEMVKEDRDRNECYPLLSLLLLSWRVEAENFAENASNCDDSKEADYSFEAASCLKAAMPCVEQNPGHADEGVDLLCATTTSPPLSDFFRLIEEAEAIHQNITEAIAASKAVLRDCLRNTDGVKSHVTTLKDHLISIRHDTTRGKMLTLPRSVEGKLDKEIKLFGWLMKAIQYPDVFRDDDQDESPSLSSIDRMPFDVLVKLNESKPEIVSGMGDFTLIVLRLKELFEAANNWQDEVSNETLLSLRGGKRRTVPSGDNEMDDGQQKIDLARVVELSTSPILKKIAMPREEAVRNMLENTKKFEVLLQDFIGKDYSGIYPDRIQLPSSSSLVDDDGRFILLRLTGSPLFVELKSFIEEIASVADQVLADTPGKATFDWICKAVKWIEELSSCIDRDKIGHSQLSVEKSAGMDLLKMADAILLDVPDDLRRTLSKYGILVSTNKDGRLTVKSKKGAAHHSIGTTTIRWSPVLFEALQEDVGRTVSWEAKLKEFAEQYKSYKASQSSAIETKEVIKAHSLVDEVSEILWEASQLVVVPEKEFFDIGVGYKHELELFIKSHSSKEIEHEYVDQALNVNSDIARDRGLLLDSLLDRAVVAGGVTEPIVVSRNINDPLFRVAARNIISHGMEQGITAIASDLDDSGDSIGLCKVRAWEIEEALFKFLQPKNQDKASPRYREKVRCLKLAFGDLSNRKLCMEVVCGKIDSEKLVRMSSEQLASPQIRRDRQVIEARAKEKTILTRSLAKKEKKEEEEENENGDQEEAKKLLRNGKSRGNGNAKEENNGKQVKKVNGESKADEKYLEAGSVSNGEIETPPKLLNGKTEDDRKVYLELPSDGNKSPASATKVSRPVTRASSRPPPPPSLADPLRSKPSVQNVVPHVLNASGSDQFTLTASNIMFSFSFVPRSILKSNVPAMLPQSLHEYGRTKVEEFIDFLSGKRNSNKWDIYILRLMPYSDADTKEYKKFYKDFEAKQRIAMFKLPNKSKLFLITPKFHKEVKNLIPLDHASSTYGVLLLRSCDL